MNKERRLEIKVGLFVLAGVALAVVVVLLLGKSRHVFQPRVTLHAMFRDVAGLVQGAPVRVSGVNVGTVAQIMFVRGRPRPQIQVDLQVTRSALALVRSDSVARISSQGLLGDKIIEVSAGSTAAPAVGEGGYVKTAEPPNLDQMVAQASAVLDDARRVADRAAKVVDEFARPKTISDLRQSITHLNELLQATARGQGLAHALFFDRGSADKLTQLETRLIQLTEHVDRGVQHVDAVLAATDDDGRQLFNNLSRAAKGVGQTADALHRSHIIGHLDRASGDLAAMTEYMKSGRGTLGALIIDPTVYDQLVTVLGGIGRSKVLRALVRFAISRDEKKGEKGDDKPPAEKPDSKPKPQKSRSR